MLAEVLFWKAVNLFVCLFLSKSGGGILPSDLISLKDVRKVVDFFSRLHISCQGSVEPSNLLYIPDQKSEVAFVFYRFFQFVSLIIL